MKTMMIVLIGLCSFFPLKGQEKGINAFYLSIEAMGGNYPAVANLHLNMVANKKYSFSFGYFIAYKDSKEAKKINAVNNWGIRMADEASGIEFLIGINSDPNRNKKIRSMLSGGLAVMNVVKLKNFQPSNNQWGYAIYDYDTTSENTVGLVFHPKLELLLSPPFGFVISSKIVVSPETIIFTVGGGINLGWTRKNLKKKG